MERHALRSAFDPPVRRLGFQKQKAVAIGIIRLKLIIPQLPQKVKSSGGRLISPSARTVCVAQTMLPLPGGEGESLTVAISLSPCGNLGQ